MPVLLRWAPLALLAAAMLACGPSSAVPVASPTAPASTSSPATTPSLTPAATATPLRIDIRASRLSIPALGIDAEVQPSQLIPDTSPATPGCPPRPPGGTTLTVPNEGIATPEGALDGLENKAWIFGHSRWLGQPGLFFRLQDISVGDEMFVTGTDRRTGAAVERRRFVVESLYLSDIDSGDRLIAAARPEQIPPQPLVILQTSVREDGANKQWILSQPKIAAKARNAIEGDVNDPCKYLLLFVFAQAS